MRIKGTKAAIAIRIGDDRVAMSTCGTKRTRCGGDSCGGYN